MLVISLTYTLNSTRKGAAVERDQESRLYNGNMPNGSYIHDVHASLFQGGNISDTAVKSVTLTGFKHTNT